MPIDRLTRWAAWLCLLVLFTGFREACLPANTAQAQPNPRLVRAYEDYQKDREQLIARLEDLEVRAVQAEANDLADLVSTKLDLLHGKLSPLPTLPRDIRPDLSYKLTPEVRGLWVTYHRYSEEIGQNFYLLARRVQSDSPTFAFELLNLVLQFHPDHPSARALRGYVRQGNEWMTPFERDQKKANRVDHPQFGWLPAAHVPEYERGLRYFLGKWMPAAQEAEIRRDFRYAWTVQTEHFQIKTNVSLERGVELGRKLELFHDYFKQTFALFYNSPEQLKRLFDENSGRVKTQAQLYEVHFFRTKEEYIAKLQPRIPQIAMTNGLYQLEDRVSYFYEDPERNLDATLFHEATHQLMYESHLKQRDVGQQEHFWIVEGIACYMESFRVSQTPSGLHYDVGDPRFIRFYWARHRLLEENYQPSLEQFARMGMQAFQTGSQQELQRRYSQASGLSHFFMHFNNGQYRDALMLHLAQLYHSNPRIQQMAKGLDTLTGVPYPTLDRQYREYLQEQQEAVGEQPVIQ